jgi:hypothetical protein
LEASIRTFLRILFAFAVSVFVLALLLHIVGGGLDKGATRLLEVLRAADVSLLFAYLGCQGGQILWRAMRYALLLRVAGEPEVPRFGHMLLVTMCRNMFVDLLPARVGEVSYIAMLNRGYRVGVESCVASLGISVLFDFVALFLIFAGLLLLELVLGSAPVWLFSVVGFLFVVVVVGIGIVFVAYGAVLRRLKGALIRLQRVMDFFERLAGAIEATRRSGVLLQVLALSLLVRACKYGGYYLAFLAIALASFPEMAALPFWKVLCTLVSSEAAASVPVPSFMSFGTYETGGVAMWTLLGFPAADAAISTLALHVVSQVVDYVVGGLGLVLFAFLVPGRTAATSARRGTLVLATAAVVVFGAMGFFFLEKRNIAKRGALDPPAAGSEVVPSSVAHSLPSELHGFIVWSSNRTGNHDIWKMDLAHGQVERITTHPHTENYPRISPDGKRIAFSRAHLPWVSQRNDTAWDVYVRELDSGSETFVASNGINAVWTADGRSLVYVQNGAQVIHHNLETGQSRVVAAAGEMGVPDGSFFSTPDFNEDSAEVSLTVRGATRMTALISANTGCRKLGGGCQLYWSPDNAFLYYVDGPGHKENALWKIDPASGARTLWFDQPGEWSHEYFPKLSNDGNWLVFGASTKGHEHDTADYEIFLWQVGAEPASAIRLTWHTGNDCWPDIWISGEGP